MGGFKAVTTLFEDLHGLIQLPSFVIQWLIKRAMSLGADGDWKTVDGTSIL
jgi:L-arabinose isomerase